MPWHKALLIKVFKRLLFPSKGMIVRFGIEADFRLIDQPGP